MASETKEQIRKFFPGSFLVATPHLQNVPYRQSVVLVMRQDAQGAMGFVMENQLKSSLRELQTYFRNPEEAGSGHEFPGLRMFTGVVLWPAGKLEHELEQGIWMRTPARLEVAMDYENLWADLLRKIGRDVLHDCLGITKFPADVTLN